MLRHVRLDGVRGLVSQRRLPIEALLPEELQAEPSRYASGCQCEAGIRLDDATAKSCCRLARHLYADPAGRGIPGHGSEREPREIWRHRLQRVELQLCLALGRRLLNSALTPRQRGVEALLGFCG